MKSSLKVQIDRMNAGLAPCDDVLAQAENTARLRGDDTYVLRWKKFEISQGRRHGKDETR